MPNAKHYVYVVGNKEAAAWQKSGVVPKVLTLTTSYFESLSSGDVLWLIRVAQNENEDEEEGRSTFVCGRFVVRSSSRFGGGKTEAAGDESEPMPLRRLNLAKARLKIEFISDAGASFGFVVSPWGDGMVTLYGESYSGFRSGWRPDVMSVQKLEQLWENSKSPAPRKPSPKKVAVTKSLKRASATKKKSPTPKRKRR